MNAAELQLDWPGIETIVRIESRRDVLKGGVYKVNKPVVRYFLTSLDEPLEQLAQRIRKYWHVENKVHYVRDVTQGEDASRLRTGMLPHVMATARDFAINLYRRAGYSNMAQATRDCSFSFQHILSLLNLK
jgi:predicted transposase YbfD/YdcC